MKKIVIGLSGGMDSATLLGLYLDQGFEVHCCFFDYGSKHNAYEKKAFFEIVSIYHNDGFPAYWHYFNLEQVFESMESNLLLTGEEIPEGHFEDEVMKKTIVPGRNMIFASIMAALAESIGAEAIALGVHAGDHAIYPDCRYEFIQVLNEAIKLSTEYAVKILTPFINLDKTGILQKGYKLIPAVRYDLTRTCYKDQSTSCGKCAACVERLEAFKNLNLNDPITYE